MERTTNGVTVGDVVVLVRSAEQSWWHSLVNAVTWQSHEGSTWAVEVRRDGQILATRGFGRRNVAVGARRRFVDALAGKPGGAEISHQSLLDSV